MSKKASSNDSDNDPDEPAASKDPLSNKPLSNKPLSKKPLAPAAQRALAEAAERHAARERESKPTPVKEVGRQGPEPTRYGDWEVKGIASDF
jgi:hypothetical protein